MAAFLTVYVNYVISSYGKMFSVGVLYFYRKLTSDFLDSKSKQELYSYRKIFNDFMCIKDRQARIYAQLTE